MKTLLIFFLLINSCFGQGLCDGNVSIYNDEASGKNYVEINERIKVMNPVAGSMEGLSFYIMKFESGEILIEAALVGGEDELNNAAAISIMFENKESLTLDMGIKRSSMVKGVMLFGGVFGKEDQLTKLMSNKIKRVSIYTRAGYRQVMFSAEEAELFNSTLICIFNTNLID